MPYAKKNLAGMIQQEKPGIVLIRRYLGQIGEALKKLHAQGVIHGDLTMNNILSLPTGRKNGEQCLAFADFDGAYCYRQRQLPTVNGFSNNAAVTNNINTPVVFQNTMQLQNTNIQNCSNLDQNNTDGLGEYLAGASHKFSTSVLPPEMIAKVSSVETRKIEGFERYWKMVSEDAKDMRLLVPDDIHTISTVVKRLLPIHALRDAAAGNLQNSYSNCHTNNASNNNEQLQQHHPSLDCLTEVSEDATANNNSNRNLQAVAAYAQQQEVTGVKNNNEFTLDSQGMINDKYANSGSFGGNRFSSNNYVQDDWKASISKALFTISFDDLPHSLTCCDTIEEFAQMWNRALFFSALWEKVKPQTVEHEDGKGEEGDTYFVKAYNDFVSLYTRLDGTMRDHLLLNNNESFIDAMNLSLLPYELNRACEKLDIWAFGVLVFSMCSGGDLFPSDYNGDITGVAAFRELHSWNKAHAEKLVMQKVSDPLAQDLLLQILVPFNERLSSMDQVLCHPFFGPASSIDAQRILEKHEEQQLLLEETTLISRMTSETQRKLENSTEKQCKIVFEEEKIAVPTFFMVLPYELQQDHVSGNLLCPKEYYNTAVILGKHLLNVNKATSRLSFWLMMKKNLHENDGVFKSKLKTWLRRARTEPGELVAMEIVSEIGCGSEYVNICREMLEKGDAVSHARAYIKDPMCAAKAAIHRSTRDLMKLYTHQLQYFYLVDEYRGVPVSSQLGSSLVDATSTYPLKITPQVNLLKKLFLPFMNLGVMTVTAVDGLTSLLPLLGLPPDYGIHDSWKGAEPGLIHRSDQPASVAEFAVLQDMIKKKEVPNSNDNNALCDDDSLNSALYISSGNSSTLDGDRSIADGRSGKSNNAPSAQMRQLEVFYREYDPMRRFSDLRRVSDGKSSAIWTTEGIVKQMKEEVELAQIESRLRDLKKEYLDKEKLKEEISCLSEQVNEWKRSHLVSYNGDSGIGFVPETVLNTQYSNSTATHASTISMNASFLNHSGQLGDSGVSFSSGAETGVPTNIDHPANNGGRGVDDDGSSTPKNQSSKKKSARSPSTKKVSKMRMRPYFGKC